MPTDDLPLARTDGGARVKAGVIEDARRRKRNWAGTCFDAMARLSVAVDSDAECAEGTTGGWPISRCAALAC